MMLTDRMRRKNILHLMNENNVLRSMIKKKRKGKKGRLWIRPGRSTQWWQAFQNETVVAEEWKENFRMSRDSFVVLCGELRTYIESNALQWLQSH